MIEVAVVFDTNGRPLHWHLPEGRSSGSIPDSSGLWNVIWENRERLGGVAHTHPWSGNTGPSITDITTYDAIEIALGKSLIWPIITMDRVFFFQKGMKDYHVVDVNYRWETHWLETVIELRRLSCSGG